MPGRAGKWGELLEFYPCQFAVSTPATVHCYAQKQGDYKFWGSFWGLNPIELSWLCVMFATKSD